MNKKNKTVFVCNSCGADFGKWVGRCTECGAWDTITEFRESASHGKRPASGVHGTPIRPITTAAEENAARIPSAFSEVDRVLGGGLVAGAVVLIGGDPGVGKSTLLLQMMAAWAARGIKTVYVSGEESFEQVALRSRRLGVRESTLGFLAETGVDAVINKLLENKPQIVVIDSIQTMLCEGVESTPGSVSQIRESAGQLLRFAKENNTSIFLVGHVTKDGTIAGPRILEHMVDTVLYFEGDANYQYRIVRAMKNRFGPSGEIAILCMSDRGFSEVTNSSELFLQSGNQPQVGTSVVPILEGSRILVVELQTLVNRTHFGLPQRVASGINPKKLSLLIAVLERHTGIMLGDHDIFFNIAGGLTVSEPAIDLGIAAALLSSFVNKPVRGATAFVGELGLGGEVRPVNNMGTRIKELQRLNFSRVIVPKPLPKADWIQAVDKNGLGFCSNIGELQELLF